MMRNAYFLSCSFLSVTLLILACTSNQEQELPKVDKPHAIIGTTYFEWTDTARADAQYGGLRAIDVQVWYPASDSSTTRASYLPRMNEAAQQFGWSRRDSIIASRVRTDAWVDAPIDSTWESYPLLIFSPGLGGRTSYSTFYAEHFTRQGYVVIGVNHLYESAYVVTDDGLIGANHTFHDSLKTLRIPAEISAENYRMTKGLRIMVLAEDLSFCLDKLTLMNEDRFNGALDFSRIGSWGHSIGGAAAIDASRIDSRIDAVVNFDGTPSGIALELGMQRPFMFIEDMTDLSMKGYEIQFDRRTSFCGQVEAEAYRVLLKHTNHQSFYDINLHEATSQQNRGKALRILNTAVAYMDDFFDQYVRGKVVSIVPLDTDSLKVMVIP